MSTRVRLLIGGGLVLAIVAVVILYRQRADALAAQTALAGTLGAAGGTAAPRSGGKAGVRTEDADKLEAALL